jgi:hypothetical protein
MGLQSVLRIDDVETSVGSGNMRVFSLRYKGGEGVPRQMPVLSGRNQTSSQLPLTAAEECLLQMLEQTDGVESVAIDEENELVVIKQFDIGWGPILVAIERGVDCCLQARV